VTPAKLKRAATHYLYAMFAQGFNAGIAAIYSFLGMATGASFDAEHFDPPGWRTLAWTFCVTFCVGILWYLKKHPLPEKLPETTPPFASTTEIKDGTITTTPDTPRAP
jgi:hypothetical protein